MKTTRSTLNRKMMVVSLSFATLLFSCSENQKKEGNSQDELSPIISFEDMSIGSANGKNSKAYYDYARFHDPATGEIPENMRALELAYAKGLPANYSRSLSWEQRGPSNIGGRTRAIAIDVLNDDIWIVGGVTGGIWRSVDAGDTWTKVTAMDQIHSVTSIVQDQRAGKENIWYAGTGEYYTVVSHATFDSRFSGNGLMKSTDNGLTWTELESTQSNTPETTYDTDGDFDYVWKLVTDNSDLTNDVVLAAVFNGIYRSEDGGDTWSEAHGFINGGLSATDCDLLDLVATDDGVFYATYSSDGISAGIYRSDDGITWVEITPASFPSSYGRIVMAVNPLNEDIVWFFGDTNGPFGNGHSIFRYQYVSGDGTGSGGLWEDRSAGLPFESCYISEIGFEAGYLNTQNSYDVAIGIHPTDTNVIYIAGTSIWRNMDGFTHDSTNTWIGGYQCSPYPYDDPLFTTSYPNHHPDQHVLMFDPSDPSKLINGNDGGVYVSDNSLADSVQWVSKNNKYITTQFYAVALEPGETTSDKIIGGMQDNNTFLTVDAELDSAWVKVHGGDGMFCAITENADLYVACSQYGRMMLYDLDEDGNYINVERLDPQGGASSYNWANRYILDPNNSKRLYWNGRNKLWRLDDLDDVELTGDKTNKHNGEWEDIDESSITGGEGIITDIEMCKDWPNTVWYGSSNGRLFRLNYATSAAPVKTDLTADAFPNSSWLSSISVNPFNKDEIIISFANYKVPSIFYTLDGGQSWTDIGGNLEENTDGSGSGPSVLWVEWYPSGLLFAGTSTGLYTTDFPDDTNTVWTLEPGIGNVIINHMDYRTYDGKFIVGTHGNGVFSTNLPAAFTQTKELVENKLKVYPTVTSESIYVDGVDGLNQYYIFDLSGKLIYRKLKTSDFETIDVRKLNSGTYIFVASDGERKEVQKFIRR